MWMKWARFGVIASIMFLFSCSPSQAACVFGMGSCDPTEAEGRQVLEGFLESVLNPPYTIQSFRKTNGKSENIFGMSMYSMEF